MKRRLLILFWSCASVAAGRELPKVLWETPGNVQERDIEGGIGGRSAAPVSPFQFLEEEHTGTSPKIKVKDAAGATWAVKFGEEAVPECFSSRLAWMVGYFVEPTYCLDRGTIEGVHGLSRAKSYVKPDGSFSRARFEVRTKEPEFKPLMDWGWKHNAFQGTHELQGLKIMMLLVSNWDNKDERERYEDGSNNGVFEAHTPKPRLLYEVIDWGASLGRWGTIATRSKCDCIGFTDQTAQFTKGATKNGVVRWSYHGKHTEEATQNITMEDVRWLMQYLGKISDAQLKAGLLASAATDVEADCFQRALRVRIDQLRAIASGPQARIVSRRH